MRYLFLSTLALLIGGCSLMGEPQITLEEYQKIQVRSEVSKGFTYSQAVAAFGESGTEISRTSIPGTPKTVIYQWQNPDGSNAIVTFQGDRAVNKAQAQLR